MDEAVTDERQRENLKLGACFKLRFQGAIKKS